MPGLEVELVSGKASLMFSDDLVIGDQDKLIRIGAQGEQLTSKTVGTL